MTEKILIIEDEPKIAGFISRTLRSEGYSVDVAYDGESGIEVLFSKPPDLLILDLMLPDMDGMEICRQVRGTGLELPILMLTARDTVSDKVLGLDAGADDYLVKPFVLDELLARIRALLRRTAPQTREPLRFADLELDPATRVALRGGRKVELTAKEYDILELFMRHPNQILTRDVIYDNIWGFDFGGESNIIEVYIRYLRSKLEKEGEPRLIHTVRGAGYILRE